MSGFQEFGFGDKASPLSSSGNKRFKGEKNTTYRVSFAWWPDDGNGGINMDSETPRVGGGKRHYVNGVGYFWDKGPEFAKIAGGPAKKVGSTVLVVWPSDATGTLDKARFAAGEFEVLPWVFGQDKYAAIEPVHREFHLGSHDLMVQCVDAQYQKMTFSPCRENLLRKLIDSSKESNNEIATTILEQVNDFAANLSATIASDLTLDQIRERMGVGTPTPLSDGGGGAVASEDIDGMLDDLLDT